MIDLAAVPTEMYGSGLFGFLFDLGPFKNGDATTSALRCAGQSPEAYHHIR